MLTESCSWYESSESRRNAFKKHDKVFTSWDYFSPPQVAVVSPLSNVQNADGMAD
jgi:hypothetical protein